MNQEIKSPVTFENVRVPLSDFVRGCIAEAAVRDGMSFECYLAFCCLVGARSMNEERGFFIAGTFLDSCRKTLNDFWCDAVRESEVGNADRS